MNDSSNLKPSYNELQKRAYRAEMRHCAMMYRSAKVDPYLTDADKISRAATYLDCAKSYNLLSK